MGTGCARALRSALLAVLAVAAIDSRAATATARAGALTRADLDLLRRRVAVLESELALARSRKTYLVVDAPGKRLRYGLLGMTLREIPSAAIRMDGLRYAGEEGPPGPLALAAITTLKEKEKDPRLSPLTPEQIEAGAADENVADALPPEAPPDFDLQFKQPIVLRVEGVPEKKNAWAGTSGWWGRLWSGRRGGGNGVVLRLVVHVDETAAREIYRSLVPGERMLLVAPIGYHLPDAGQEPPRSVRPGRPAKPPVLQPGPSPQGVPFRIPPPVDQEPADGAGPASAGAEGPAVDGAPERPAEATPEPTPRHDDPPVRDPLQGDPSPESAPASPPRGGGGA